MNKRIEDAYEMVKKLLTANIFYHDIPKKTALRIGLLGCGIIDDNDFVKQEGLRWLCNFYQFKRDPFRLFTTLIDGGKAVSASNTQMKYIARTIKLMDAILSHERKKNKNKEGNQIEEDEIRELDNAILSMNVDPSTMEEQGFQRYFQGPGDIKRELGDRVFSTELKKPNPIILSLFGQIMNITRNHIASTGKSFLCILIDIIFNLILFSSILYESLFNCSQ